MSICMYIFCYVLHIWLILNVLKYCIHSRYITCKYFYICLWRWTNVSKSILLNKLLFCSIYLLHRIFTFRPKLPPGHFFPLIIFFSFYISFTLHLYLLANISPHPILFNLFMFYNPSSHFCQYFPLAIFPPSSHFFFSIYNIFHTASSPFGQDAKIPPPFPGQFFPLIHFFSLYVSFTLHIHHKFARIIEQTLQECKMANAKTWQKMLPM